MSTFRQFHDQLMTIMEAIDREPIDSATRLRWIRDIDLALHSELIRRRNQAAYELRLTHNTLNAEKATGISRDKISGWVQQHRDRTGAPRIPSKRQDMTGAVDLSAGGHFPLSHPH